MNDYNNRHPNDSLENMTPVELLRSKCKTKLSTFTS